VAESTGGRRNRIDTLLVCRVGEPGSDAEDGAEATTGEGDRTAAAEVPEHTGSTAVGSTAAGRRPEHAAVEG
jgi:hypothetical protein